MNRASSRAGWRVIGNIARGMLLGLLLSLSLFVLYAVQARDIADFRYLHF